MFDYMEEKRGWYGHYDDYGINWMVVTDEMRDVLDALRPELKKGNVRLVVRTILKFIHTLQERNDETLYDDDYASPTEMTMASSSSPCAIFSFRPPPYPSLYRFSYL